MTDSTFHQRQPGHKWCRARQLGLMFALWGLFAAGCTFADEVQDDVDERFRRPEVTDRFAQPDDDASSIDNGGDGEPDDGEPDDGEVVFRERFDPLQSLARPNRDQVDERTSDLVGSGEWHTEVELRDVRVDMTAMLDVDLFELSDQQLVGLDLIDSADVEVPRSSRWYRIDGDLIWSLDSTVCVPQPSVDACAVSLATDGSLVGLAELVGDRLRVVLSWRELGRGQLGWPELVVEVTDASGRKTDHRIDALRESVEAAFVDWEFGINVDSGPQPFTAVGLPGSGQLEFVRNQARTVAGLEPA